MNCCTHDCLQGRKCPLRTKDGGESVNGDIAFPLHRQVMPPDQPSDLADWVWYWVSFFLAIGLVTFIAWSAA